LPSCRTVRRRHPETQARDLALLLLEKDGLRDKRLLKMQNSNEQAGTPQAIDSRACQHPHPRES
ncbi:MAG: hypothetical protein V3T85_05380, partial [Acidiferrobacterales bacterium]